MRAAKIESLLKSVDSLLIPMGFKRRAREQEWHKTAGNGGEMWIHVNIGKDVVNPSVGVRYSDLADVLPSDAGAVFSSMRMLAGLFRPVHVYTLSAGPQAVVEDLSEKGLATLERLLDRAGVIEMLQAESPREWPVLAFSFRIRLLPLLLATLGRVDEALAVADKFLAEAAGRDQSIPAYGAFHEAFRSKFAV
jgi:hypothetical protein